MKKYPVFRKKELNGLVKQIKTLDGEIKRFRGLEIAKLSLEDELREKTYEWFVGYELQVRYDKRESGLDWLDPFQVEGCKQYLEKFVETKKEAMKGIKEAKDEIKKHVDRRTIARPFYRKYPVEIRDYNITLALITKGEKIVYKKERPGKVLRGGR